METGEPGPVVPHPPGLRTMFRKIALCAMLVLILAPVAVMAAGQQGQAQGMGNEAGNCPNVQQQTAAASAAQEKYQNGQDQAGQGASRNGDMLMVQTRSQDQTCNQNQTCDKDQDMVRNMTRDQVRLNADAGAAGEQGPGSNGNARMLQAGSCDQNCDQDQDMMRNMTRDQVRLNTDAVQQQNGEPVQNQSGPARGNGQNILTGFAEQLGLQFRNMGGIVQALLHNGS